MKNTHNSVRIFAATLITIGSLAGAVNASVVTIDTNITLNAINVSSGPTFQLTQNIVSTDVFKINVSGMVDLSSSDYITNAAGVVVDPAVTHIPTPRGSVTNFNGVPYGAILVGNAAVGFHPIFEANASTGLGSATPPTDLELNREFGDIFDAADLPSLTTGTTLEFRINDENTAGNSGSFTLVPVPEPSSALLMGIGLLGFLTRRYRGQ